MGVMHRDLGRREPGFVHRLAMRIMVPLTRWVFARLPTQLRSMVDNSVGGRSGRVFSLIAKGRFAEAFPVAMAGVIDCQTHPGFVGINKLYWWVFLERAACCAVELGDDERRQVLAQLEKASEPGGMLEAQCLSSVARWNWAAGDATTALGYARRALLCDPSWPYGHIMLAFYELGTCDPLPRLAEAVRLSAESLQTIRDNPSFAGVPGLIAALTAA